MKKYWILAAVILIGCPKATKIPPVAPPVKPVFEKTFGEITYGGGATLLIEYKDIHILVDPLFESGALQKEGLPPLDYLLLTDCQPHHWSPQTKDLRKNLKIIAPPEEIEPIESQGFTQAKGLSNGQRILLKKNDGFLFVTVLTSRNPATGRQVNGYLLEFDNGKNLFVSGETVDEAVIREFVYGLRDDGKQVELAFVYAGGLKSKNNDTWQSCNEPCAAMMIGLLQPRVAVLLQTDAPESARFNEDLLRSQLKEQIYYGGLYRPSPGDVIAF